MIRACLSQFPPLFLALAVIAAAPNRFADEPVHGEIPHFVEAAGAEYDLEQEAKEADRARGLSPAEQLQAVLGKAVRRAQRWRVYLRSDGTWAPDPMLGKQDYAEHHYPAARVETATQRNASDCSADTFFTGL